MQSSGNSGNQYDQMRHPGEQRQNGNQVIVDYYNRRESTFSDHRPVLGIFLMRVRKINYRNLEAIRGEIINGLCQNMSTGANGA